MKNRKHTESLNTRGRWRIPLAILVLLAGALGAWWLGNRADHEMRAGLLAQARLAAGAVKTDHVKALTGTAADLESPDYLRLKEQFAAMRAAEPKCRFVYLMGQKAAPPSVPAQGSAQAGGDIFFFVDSEPAGSKDYSPPGQVYEEAPDGYRRVFDTRIAEVEGPVTDRWGTWVSALIPLLDPKTGELIAVLGMDIDAADWKWDVAAKAALPAGLVLLIMIGIAAAMIGSGRAQASPKPVLRRLLPALTLMLLLLFALAGTLLWHQHQDRLDERTAVVTSEVNRDLHEALQEQARGLALALQLIVADKRTREGLRSGDRERLLADWGPLFETLRREQNLTHFNVISNGRVLILRMQQPELYGDKIDRFTTLESERTGKMAWGMEAGRVGALTLRVVAPVFDGATRIGYVELGREIDESLKAMSRSPGTELAVILHKNQLRRETWEAGMKMLGHEADWNRLPHTVVIYASQGRLPDAFAALADQNLAGGHEHNRFDREITDAGKIWRFTAFGLADASGKEVGELLVMNNITALKTDFNRVIAMGGTAGGILLALLLVTVFVLLRRTDAGIREQQKALRESEEHLSATLRSIGDGVIACDLDGRVVNLNSAAEALTGWSAAEAVGRPLEEVFRIIHAQTREPAENPVRRALAEGVNVDLANHTALIAKDGAERQIADSCVPIRDASGTVTGAVLVFRDVTEEYRRREELAAAHRNMQDVMDAASQVSFIATDPDGLITVFNTGAEQMLGYSAQEMVGKTPGILHLPAEVEARGKELSEEFGRPVEGFDVFVTHAREGRFEEREWTYVRKDGARLTVNLVVAAVRDEDGRVTGFLGVAQDITARKRAEEAALLEQRRAEALLSLSQISNRPEEEVIATAVEAAISLTGSDIGYFATLDESESVLTMRYWSKSAHAQCQVTDKPIIYPVAHTGLWGEAVRQRKPIITNDYAAPNPLKHGTPEGHVPVVRHMNIPVFFDNRMVAVAGVGNKQSDYNEGDVRQLQIFMNGLCSILQRKKAEDKLRTLSLVVEASSDAIGMSTPSGKHYYQNKAFDDLFGDVGEDPPASLYLDEQIGREVFNTIMAGNPWSGEIQMRGRSGVVLDVFVRAYPIKDEAGTVLSLVGIHTDITDRKRAEEGLRETNRQLEEATARANEMAVHAEMASIAKSEFLANMSHEIRTPMNGVIGMTGLLLDTELSEDQRRYAGIVKSSGESLLALINDILDFSKIEAGKLDMEVLDFDLRSLLDDFAATMALRTHDKGLELLCAADPDVPTLLSGDPGRLRQILTNLAGNAVKFTHQGEVAVRVSRVMNAECGMRNASCVLRFSVRDTGIGIPADKIGMLFSKFTQVDASTTRQYGGTGLGLAISKQLAGMMGGEIGVESVLGKGSEFWFTARFGLRADAAREVAAPPAGLSGVHVLIVDDNATSREILVTRLRSWGMRPEEAGDGPSGLQALHRALGEDDPFRLAIVDMQMPGMNGEAVGRAVHADARIAGTRLVMLTSLGARGDAKRLLEAGFVGYAVKPVRHEELRDVLSQALAEGADGVPRPMATRHTAREAQPDFSQRRARILLAEDNITNQQVALAILRKFGLSADVVANGREALEALKTLPYDLVLMDVQMPEMDGLEATRRIRNPQTAIPNRSIPIIAMTAHAMQGDQEMCLVAGMNDYITKPVSPAALAGAIEKWLPEEGGSRESGGRIRNEHTGKTGSSLLTPPSTLIWDRAAMLERLMGDEDLARTISEGFLNDMPRQIARLKEYLEAGDAASAERQAHTIKGAASNVGGEALRAVAFEMEKAGKAGDLGAVNARMDILEAAFDQLRREMNEAS